MTSSQRVAAFFLIALVELITLWRFDGFGSAFLGFGILLCGVNAGRASTVADPYDPKRAS